MSIKQGIDIPRIEKLGPFVLVVLFADVRVVDHDFIGGFCWDWMRYVDKDGYPRIKLGGVDYKAHRVAYAIFVKDGCLKNYDIHHECGNRLCINPLHLSKQSCKSHRMSSLNHPHRS